MFSTRTDWKLTRNRYTEAIEAAQAAGCRLLDLTASNPTRIGLSYDSAAILGALGSTRAMDYDPQAKGLLSAREAVASYYAERLASGQRDVAGKVPTGIDPERVVLTTSTSEGYSFVFRLICNAGDELLVPKPSYPLFEFLADLQDVKLAPYPLIYDHGWQMDFHSLEKAVTGRTRGVVVVHPNNPTGSYVQAGEFAALNAFCKAHELALIVDEVFLDYPVDGREHTSFVSNEDVLTFTLSGLSKISALPQMKVAWVATSGPQGEAGEAMERLEVIADTYLSMNAPTQWAIPILLEQRKSIQQQLLGRVKKNLAELDRQLAQQKACERLCVEGGWYAVLRVPVTRSDEELAIELVRKKSVLVHPGHFYDFPSDGCLVLSLIAEEQEFREGIVRVLEMLNC
ncbi:MAG TPA: pyridoxal phosphate-dependent aminotransferase [Candidatus Sulfotelmatobacter sp.]|nr:pyridoxal phosphate-dependent aminotransferase [Candidatus Sulfotelmatobacter sp.]